MSRNGPNPRIGVPFLDLHLSFLFYGTFLFYARARAYTETIDPPLFPDIHPYYGGIWRPSGRASQGEGYDIGLYYGEHNGSIIGHYRPSWAFWVYEDPGSQRTSEIWSSWIYRSPWASYFTPHNSTYIVHVHALHDGMLLHAVRHERSIHDGV